VKSAAALLPTPTVLKNQTNGYPQVWQLPTIPTYNGLQQGRTRISGSQAGIGRLGKDQVSAITARYAATNPPAR